MSLMSKKVLRVGTDCSGIEAPIQALEQLNLKFKHVFSSDIDPYCIESIKGNYKPGIIYKDMTKRDVKKIPDIDLYVCGFPCQTFSMAGNRKGTKDKRGKIFNYCLEVIEEKLPSFFILENVKGLLSIDKGKTFDNIIQSLEDLDFYDIYWEVLNTKDYGIPQNRERIFIIGIAKDLNIDFKFPKTKKCKSLKSFIDKSDKADPNKAIPNRVTFMKKNIPKDSIFIDLAFKNFSYPNSNKYSPCIARNGSLWCVPMNRYANIKELLALQGFKNFKQVVSKSQLKKQIGNSMSVCVLKELFKEMLKKC